MRFRILGDLRVLSQHEAIPPGGPRERRLLAALLLNANRVVSVAKLVDFLWDGATPSTADKQVRNVASRLRAALAAAGPPPIEAVAVGYRLTCTPDTLDALDFERHSLRAEQAAASGDPERAAWHLREALALWHGPALAGMTGAAIEAAARVWDERHFAAREAYAEYALQAGLDQDIVADLFALVAEQPLRQKPASLLMLALHRGGRQSEALAAYQALRHRLQDEVGLDPGTEARRLHQRIIEDDPSLARPAPTPRSGSPDIRIPHQLPRPIGYFVGHDEALNTLHELAAGVDPVASLAAIDGPAGVGKTTLAVHFGHQAAHRFPDGQLYLNLRGFTPSAAPLAPEEALAELLTALGVAQSRLPTGPEARAALLRGVLTDRRVLLILDNAHDAGQVRPLLPAAPGCLTVVTSRRDLRGLVAGDGALPITVAVLDEVDARELLVRRLGAERVHCDREGANALVAACGGLPLTVNIAAAQAVVRPDLALGDLAAALRENRLHSAVPRLARFSTDDQATEPRSVFSWSYDDLDAATARTFRLLGLHPTPDIPLTAIAALCATEHDQLREMLAALSQLHLVEHDDGRVILHDLLLDFAADICAEDPEQGPARHRMLDHYLHTAFRATRCMDPTRDPIELDPPLDGAAPLEIADPEAARTWFEAEQASLPALVGQAAATGFPIHAWQLAWSLTDHFRRRGQWSTCTSMLRVALAAAQDADDLDGQIRMHASLGQILRHTAHREQGLDHMLSALTLAERHAMPVTAAHQHLGLSQLLGELGRRSEALDHATHAVHGYRATGHHIGLAMALNSNGWLHAELGDHQTAIALCQEALELTIRLEADISKADTLDSLGFVHARSGDHEAAISYYRQALETYRRLNISYYCADVLTNLGQVHLDAGDQHMARTTWLEALDILSELDHPNAQVLRGRLRDLREEGEHG